MQNRTGVNEINQVKREGAATVLDQLQMQEKILIDIQQKLEETIEKIHGATSDINSSTEEHLPQGILSMLESNRRRTEYIAETVWKISETL